MKGIRKVMFGVTLLASSSWGALAMAQDRVQIPTGYGTETATRDAIPRETTFQQLNWQLDARPPGAYDRGSGVMVTGAMTLPRSLNRTLRDDQRFQISDSCSGVVSTDAYDSTRRTITFRRDYLSGMRADMRYFLNPTSWVMSGGSGPTSCEAESLTFTVFLTIPADAYTLTPPYPQQPSDSSRGYSRRRSVRGITVSCTTRDRNILRRCARSTCLSAGGLQATYTQIIGDTCQWGDFISTFRGVVDFRQSGWVPPAAESSTASEPTSSSSADSAAAAD
jgi:hypothetical protein